MLKSLIFSFTSVHQSIILRKHDISLLSQKFDPKARIFISANNADNNTDEDPSLRVESIFDIKFTWCLQKLYFDIFIMQTYKELINFGLL